MFLVRRETGDAVGRGRTSPQFSVKDTQVQWPLPGTGRKKRQRAYQGNQPDFEFIQHSKRVGSRCERILITNLFFKIMEELSNIQEGKLNRIWKDARILPGLKSI